MSALSSITLFFNTGFTPANSTEVDFADETERSLFFATFNQEDTEIKYKNIDMSTSFKAKIASSIIGDDFYDYAKITDYKGHVYYCFITAIDYISDATCELTFMLDTFQTYHGIRVSEATRYLPSLVEREHGNRTSSGEIYVDTFAEPFPDILSISSKVPLEFEDDADVLNLATYVYAFYLVTMTINGVIERFLAYDAQPAYRQYDFYGSNGSGTTPGQLVNVWNIDRYDPNLIKIEKLPSLIKATEATFGGSSVAIEFPLYLEVTAGVLGGYMPKIVQASDNAPLILPLASYATDEIVFPQGDYSSTNDSYNYQKESKIYSSQFYSQYIRFGDATIEIPLERYNGSGVDIPFRISVTKAIDEGDTFALGYVQLPDLQIDEYPFANVSMPATLPLYSSDYLDYMRSRSANLEASLISDGISIGASIVSIIGGFALASAGATAPIGAAAIFSGVTSLVTKFATSGASYRDEYNKKEELKRNGGARVSGSSTIMLARSTGYDKPYLVRKKPLDEVMQNLAFIFHITGYYRGIYITPNVSSRYNFNSLKGNIEFTTAMPLMHRQDLSNRYLEGLLIIHFHESDIYGNINSYYKWAINKANKEV